MPVHPSSRTFYNSSLRRLWTSPLLAWPLSHLLCSRHSSLCCPSHRPCKFLLPWGRKASRPWGPDYALQDDTPGLWRGSRLREVKQFAQITQHLLPPESAQGLRSWPHPHVVMVTQLPNIEKRQPEDPCHLSLLPIRNALECL